MGFAHGLRGHCPHLAGLKPGNPLGKTGQAVPAALHGVLAQVALSVKPVALPNGFLDVLHAPQVSRFQLPDFQTKTVGAQVNGGEERLVFHGGVIADVCQIM